MESYNIDKMKEKAGKNSQLLQKINEAEQILEDVLEMDVPCDQQKIALKDGGYKTRCGMSYKKGDTPQCHMHKNLQCEHDYKLSQYPDTE